MPNPPNHERFLAGFLNRPYRVEEVIAAMRALQPPSLLREIAAEAALPIQPVQRVLRRLVKKGRVTRFKVRVAYTHYIHGKVIPGGRIRNVWAYTLVAGE